MGEIRANRGLLRSGLIDTRTVTLSPVDQWTRDQDFTALYQDDLKISVKINSISDAAWDSVNAFRKAFSDGPSVSTFKTLLDALSDKGHDVFDPSDVALSETFSVSPIPIKKGAGKKQNYTSKHGRI